MELPRVVGEPASLPRPQLHPLSCKGKSATDIASTKYVKNTPSALTIKYKYFLLLFLTWIATHLDFKAHEPVTSVLGKTVWQKLIKQVCHHSIDINGWGPHQELHKRMEVVVLNYF